MIEELKKLVNIDSGSYTKEGIDKIINLYKKRFTELGFKVKIDQQEEYGNNLIAKYEGDLSGNYLFLGHVDTVFKEGTVEERPFEIEGDYAYGPGVCDMKGGVVLLYNALKALIESNSNKLPDITVILNGDEEIGSPTSRSIIEKEGRKASHCFVLEPGREDHSLVTYRKGVGIFDLQVQGVASHAGSKHEKGRSAIEELARKIIDIHQLTDYDRGVTLNVGVIEGGERSNIVAEKAKAAIDLRVDKLEDGEKMERKLEQIAENKYIDGTESSLTGGMNRPPMKKTDKAEKMYEVFKGIGNDLGMEIGEQSTGGGSDGNFVSALGVPTIDAFGPVGTNAHSDKEYIEVDTLVSRAKLLAQGILELSDRYLSS